MRAADQPRRPATVWILLVLLVVQGLVGCGLMIWILVEITIIPFSWLQPFFGGVGLLIFIFSLLRPVRRFYGVSLPGET